MIAMKEEKSDITTAKVIDRSLLMTQPPSLGWVLVKSLLKSGSYQVGDRLPSVEAYRENLLINRKHLKAYNQLCGFDGHKIPSTYLWVLCFPLVIKILLSKQFPLRAMGQIHLRNRISHYEPVDLHSPLNFQASVGSSDLTSRGLEWNIDLLATAGARAIWSSRSTFLYRCQTSIERKVTNEPELLLEPLHSWPVNKKVGRQYATLSGDYNPIHLSALSAKMFGFKRAIAHGMWSKARCLAELDRFIPEAGYTVDVAFRRPVFLPSKVCLSSDDSQDARKFSLTNTSGSQIHLDGTIYKEFTNA